MKQYTLPEYAKKIRKSRQWVHELVRLKKLKAKRIGRIWVIEK